MAKIEKIRISSGIFWVSVPKEDFAIQCGCPADSVKHLKKLGLIKRIETEQGSFETGPSAILLSDLAVQKGVFANLAEFPILQMLYLQGKIMPNHPNNKGDLPILIGTKKQVEAQMQYIHRGNYGLTSIEEILQTGIDEKMAKQLMRLKLSFAFGKIVPTDQIIKGHVFDHFGKTEIAKGIFIERLKVNVFKLSYEDESVIVDLNLRPGETYGPPFKLEHQHIKHEYFAIIHSGDGDGWDPDRPCMSSIILYNGHIYLIDAGPNITSTLNSLGISVSAIRGVFHTHAHDDHFAGLTTLIRADHRIKYIATPLVRASVTKKLCALMSLEESWMESLFEIVDLKMGVWNEIDGLNVRPYFSPHPVENTNFSFRVISDGGFKTYAHLADTTSLSVLKKMLVKKESEHGLGLELFEQVKKDYSQKVDVKKIDVGGGAIHGDAMDFKLDQSEKIILSHTARDFNVQEREIGSRASFGMVDVLIPSNRDEILRYAKKYLKAYFPELSYDSFRDILNGPIICYNAGSIIIKKKTQANYIYLTLTGNMEMINSELEEHYFLTAGSLIGEINGIEKKSFAETYRSLSYVYLLKIPVSVYLEFVNQHDLREKIKSIDKNRCFLRQSPLFADMAMSATINTLAKNLITEKYKKGEAIRVPKVTMLLLVKNGQLELLGEKKGRLKKGDFCFYEKVLDESFSLSYQVRAYEDSTLCFIPAELLRKIPALIWRLMEFREKLRIQDY